MPLRLAAVLAFIAAAHAAGPVPAPTPDPEPPPAGKFYKSPRAFFEASQAATKKKDYKALIDCVAPEARAEMAGQMAASMQMLKGIGLPGLADAGKAADAVMKKYGLEGKAVGIGNPADVVAAGKAYAKMIKKPEAFALEMLAAQEKMQEALKGVVPGFDAPTMSLKEAKVTGAKARGVIEVSIAGTATTYPLDFVKGPNGWRMLLPRLDEVGAAKKE